MIRSVKEKIMKSGSEVCGREILMGHMSMDGKYLRVISLMTQSSFC